MNAQTKNRNIPEMVNAVITDNSAAAEIAESLAQSLAEIQAGKYATANGGIWQSVPYEADDSDNATLPHEVVDIMIERNISKYLGIFMVSS